LAQGPEEKYGRSGRFVGFSGKGISLLLDFLRAIALQIQQPGQVAMVEAKSCGGHDSGLGAEGYTKPGALQHGYVVGAVADGGRGLQGQAQMRGDPHEHRLLPGPVEDGLRDLAGELVLDDLKPIGVEAL
jgi:hypothetical protein